MTDTHRPDFESLAASINSTLDAGLAACESCDADVALIDTGGHVYVVEIRHDEDCPVLAHHERSQS
jgi:hypothetical protein